MVLNDMIPAGMEPVIAVAAIGGLAAVLLAFERLVKLYAIMLRRRQREHDRRAEEKRQQAIGLYGVDE